VDPMFRMHIVTQKDGAVQAGLIRRDDAGSLVLVNATGQEITVAKDTITKDELAPVSLMPATFGAAIPEADFHHLLAWLATQRTK
jgi:putative heme-binding domain-containing protein